MKDNETELLVDGGFSKTKKIIVQKYKSLSNPCFFRKQGFFVASNNFTTFLPKNLT